jgi:protein-S-isoprenylcysteine O-methyltransferase Ste14
MTQPPSPMEVEPVRTEGPLWSTMHWLHRRRPLLTALIVTAALAHTLWSGREPADLLSSGSSPRVVLAWSLMVVGAFVRLWGAGNLRKNKEITDTGIYRLVRHPLYLGSLCLFLAFFLSVGDPWVGLGLFGILVGGVYYPTMLSEERHLTHKFPERAETYRPPPRILPDPTRLGTALETDRFDARTAYRNLGFRGFWFLPGLPLFLLLLARVQASLGR